MNNQAQNMSGTGVPKTNMLADRFRNNPKRPPITPDNGISNTTGFNSMISQPVVNNTMPSPVSNRMPDGPVADNQGENNLPSKGFEELLANLGGNINSGPVQQQEEQPRNMMQELALHGTGGGRIVGPELHADDSYKKRNPQLGFGS